MTNTITQKQRLEVALTAKRQELADRGVTDIKAYEHAFQRVIEEVYPEKAWWKTTSCQIFMNLLAYHNPRKTVKTILQLLKED